MPATRCWPRALRPGEWLLTAQHAEDQLETVLLQLLRGAAWPAWPRCPSAVRSAPACCCGRLLGVPALRCAATCSVARIALERGSQQRATRASTAITCGCTCCRRCWRAGRPPPRTVARSGTPCWRRQRRCCGAQAQPRRRRRGRRRGPGSCGAAAPVAAAPAPARCAAGSRRGGLPLPDERRLAEVLRASELRADATPLRAVGRAWRRAPCTPGPAAACSPLAGSGAPESGAGRAAAGPGAGSGAWCCPAAAACSSCAPTRGATWTCALAAAAGAALARRRRTRARLRRAIAMSSSCCARRTSLHGERGRVPLVCAPAAPPGAEARLLAIADLWIAAAIRSHARTRQRGRFVWQQQ